MTDKWSKLSIYDVDFKLTDEDGEEHNFTFKPLPWSEYPKAFQVFNNLQEVGFFNVSEDATEQELVNHFFKCVNQKLINELADVCYTLVQNSYPDKDEGQVKNFVMGNMFYLIDPLSKVISRQSKSKRKAEKSLGNE